MERRVVERSDFDGTGNPLTLSRKLWPKEDERKR